ncbi:hypothetical protein BBJ28_00005913 [Nothophytophthora sp. Chile5]|nr:hypothetical protein BBJ28_00005913 [Nothophytophthora sp. Chile5]
MPLSSPLASVASALSKNSKNPVLPMVLTSAGIAGYARYASSQSLHASAEQDQEPKHDAQVLHQHVVYPWKGTR